MDISNRKCIGKSILLMLFCVFVTVALVQFAGGEETKQYYDGPIDGVVVDSVTNSPIEGAVVHLAGYGTEGAPGLTHTVRWPVEETVTDAQGRFHLKGYGAASRRAALAIYKQGYSCWDTAGVYNGAVWGKRHAEKWTWRSGYVYKMDKYNPEWSHITHTIFIDSALGQSKPGSKFDEAIEYERDKAAEERRIKRGR